MLVDQCDKTGDVGKLLFVGKLSVKLVLLGEAFIVLLFKETVQELMRLFACCGRGKAELNGDLSCRFSGNTGLPPLYFSKEMPETCTLTSACSMPVEACTRDMTLSCTSRATCTILLP